MTTTLPNSLPMVTTSVGATIVTLTNPDHPVVVLDRSLLDRLDQALDRIPADSSAVFIQSADPKVFVAGANLKEIDALDDASLLDYLARGASVLGRLAELPCPTFALLNGAALGGGLELALHCSGIVASRLNSRGKPYPIGLPEAGLGLCPGWGGTQLLPGRIDPERAIASTAVGETFSSDDLPDGLADAIAETPEHLLDVASELLGRWPASSPRRSIQSSPRETVEAAVTSVCGRPGDAAPAMAVCQAIQTGLDLGFESGLEAERRLLVALRQTDETRSKITAFLTGSR